MKLNNRGMTLVEMIVAFAILGIVSASIFSMIVTGTKTYTRLTNTVKVQYDAQLASAKIEKQLLNCSDGIYWQQNQIVMVEDNTVHAYTLNTRNNTLYYGTGTLGFWGDANLRMYVLAENVDSIGIANDKRESENGQTVVKYVQLQMKFERNGKEYSVDKTVTLRNTPEWRRYNLSFTYR